MKKLITSLAFIALLVAGCAYARGQAAPSGLPHPLLKDLKAPPLNKPIVLASLPAEGGWMRPHLPQDDLPSLLILLGDQPFSGTLSKSGELVITEELIELQPARGQPLRILYRTPRLLANRVPGTLMGQVEVIEYSGPGGANRRVIVTDAAQSLLFAEVWQSAEQPLTVALSDALRLVQTESEPNQEGDSYTETELHLLDGDRVVATLPIGAPTRVETSAGEFEIFVEVSHLFTSSDPGLAQYPSSYILHLWMVGLR